MHFLYSDARRNRLHQILVGTLDARGAAALLADADHALAMLHPGYEFLSDLRDLTAVNDDAEPVIRLLMERCGARHPSLLVRVLRAPTASFGFTIMSMFHYPRDVHVVTCTSLAEAAARLSPEPTATEIASVP